MSGSPGVIGEGSSVRQGPMSLPPVISPGLPAPVVQDRTGITGRLRSSDSFTPLKKYVIFIGSKCIISSVFITYTLEAAYSAYVKNDVIQYK